MPEKGDPKKGTRRKFFPGMLVILGTFRKLALRASDIRNASPSDSVACREFSHGFGTDQKIKILFCIPMLGKSGILGKGWDGKGRIMPRTYPCLFA
jgi:hypothetical protein